MYLNKLFILKKLQQANTHLGLSIRSPGSKWSRFNAQRVQSYIYGFRAAQPIIDLDKTVISLRRACNVIQLIIRSKGHLLLVNTNPKYNKIIQHTAKFTNQSFINHKWIGGFLTNWNHMRHVQQQFHAAARLTKALFKENSTFNIVQHPPRSSAAYAGAPEVHTSGGSPKTRGSIKGEALSATLAGILTDPKYKKMQKCFEGTIVSSTKMNSFRKFSPTPLMAVADCVVIFNANQNSTAIYEAHGNQIPIISLVDSNIPNELYNLITYPIPANSESVQFIYLFCNCILKTILLSR